LVLNALHKEEIPSDISKQNYHRRRLTVVLAKETSGIRLPSSVLLTRLLLRVQVKYSFFASGIMLPIIKKRRGVSYLWKVFIHFLQLILIEGCSTDRETAFLNSEGRIGRNGKAR